MISSVLSKLILNSLSRQQYVELSNYSSFPRVRNCVLGISDNIGGVVRDVANHSSALSKNNFQRPPTP